MAASMLWLTKSLGDGLCKTVAMIIRLEFLAGSEARVVLLLDCSGQALLIQLRI